ncbi:MAG: hypothetical protein U1G08_17195 [Verrucomicrobiota bacterium]
MQRTHLIMGLAALFAAAIPAGAADITVTTENNVNPPSGQTSLAQALAAAQAGDTIKFNIPGAGPHVLVTPIGGYPLITVDNLTIDGYSQPGSKPNSNGILGGNNANIQIVLDSTDPSQGVNPDNPDQPLRRSTRLLYSGYGDSENAMLGVVGADGFKVRGLAFIGRQTAGSTEDPSIYAIALVQEALNAKVQGCWFGLKPGDEPTQANLKPMGSAVAAFRHREPTDTYSGGLTVGTDGDGTGDVGEFNVILGCHIALAIEAPNLRVSGNYVNVFPDGVSFVDVDAINQSLLDLGREGNDASVEFMENGRQANNTIIGTNGDGKSDGNERNIVAHTAYEVHAEFYSNATNTVIAGNYFGIGVDGVTAAPVPTSFTPNFLALPGNADVRIGSNGDGISDSIEGNLLVQIPGTRLSDSGKTVPLTVRRNTYSGNAFDGFPFADGENGTYEEYYANALLEPVTGTLPVIDSVVAGIMKGTLPAPNTANYPGHVVDVYVVDPKAGEAGLVVPGTYAGSFVEGSAADQNAAPNAFTVDLKGMSIAPGAQIAIAVTYTGAAKGTPGTNSITGPLSKAVVADIPVVEPGSIESVGLSRITPDTPVIVPELDSLGNWEPNASVVGTNVFLIEGNTFAEGGVAPLPDGRQRYVVALQPAAGGAMKLGDGFFADAGTPFRTEINKSRENGNPGRVAGDKRPGAVNFIVGGEASPHAYAAFQSNNRWNFGFQYSGLNADGNGPEPTEARYGTIQAFALNSGTLAQSPLFKAFDSANGRLTEGTAPSAQVTRFGGDVAALDNGNFVSVVEDRSRVRNPDGNCATATILAPDGSIVTESFMVAKGDLWANVAAFRGGWGVRVAGVFYLFDNAGQSLGTIDQNTSGDSFDRGRGDGTRIAGHINSPYIFLGGKISTANMVKVAVWDTRDRSFVASAEVSEPAFAGSFDRVNLAVDALNRVVVSWVSQPDGYEANQVAARVLALDDAAKTITPLTSSFLPFINAAKSGGIRTLGMSVALTTRQICIAAKGEINLQNKPDLGASINPNTGEPLKEINFYTVFTHPNPQDDPTPPVGGNTPQFTKITVNPNNGTITLEWTGNGTLETASSLGGNWFLAPAPSTSPKTLPIESPAAYFRLRN